MSCEVVNRTNGIEKSSTECTGPCEGCELARNCEIVLGEIIRNSESQVGRRVLHRSLGDKSILDLIQHGGRI